ncbi:membrane dipeptidase [Lysobacter sp. Root983]|uniref:dipeptidase n=1 Tax=Lysobacter sp. Root983 TaxID=1736613 RepID=UPI00070FD9A9|nr:membrane dipeptidase [Lysobacter sp. Root983]KRD76992.1 dipeptidase [Lysobacter sp. Root983]
MSDDLSPRLSRRALLLASAGAALALNLRGAAAAKRPRRADPGRYSARARAVVERALVIDMLAPLRLDLRPDVYTRTLSEAEIADFRASGIDVFHNAWGLEGADARERVAEYLAGWHGFLARHSDLFLLVDRAVDLDRAKRDGKIAVIAGVQNAEQFRSKDDVKFFHGLGLRCAQLTYNSQTLIGSGSTEREDGGLSDYGVAIVQEMERVGVLVDVSHCGARTTLDAIELAKGPIAITHSNCRALNDHPRLKTDEAIRKLAAKGGVMGITGVRMFVGAKEPTTIDGIVDHIDHVAKLVGIEHVGIGSDADLYGYDAMPADQLKALRAAYKASYGFRERIDIEGFDRPTKIYELTEALIKRGYADADIEAVLGGNFRRLLGQVWR